MANIKDFAVGLVNTGGAPSPATSGTSITLRSGEGSTMPTPPFYVTATPPGQLTTIGTSEKLLVTAVAGDVLTVVRAQTPTSAKSIADGWIIANALYVNDVMTSNIVIDEALTGTINGTNKVFTTANSFSKIDLKRNGVAMHLTDDFTVTGTNQVTFVTAPTTGSRVTGTYIMGSSVMIAGSNSLVTDEVPTGSVNGSNTAFTTSKPYVAGSLEVFINGVKQARTTHFTETTPTSGIFSMGDAPLTGDNIIVNYQFAATVSGNADTVDGYHASATPTANMVPVLDNNAKIPASIISGSPNLVSETTLGSAVTSFTISGLDIVSHGNVYQLVISGAASAGVDITLAINGDTTANFTAMAYGISTSSTPIGSYTTTVLPNFRGDTFLFVDYTIIRKPTGEIGIMGHWSNSTGYDRTTSWISSTQRSNITSITFNTNNAVTINSGTNIKIYKK